MVHRQSTNSFEFRVMMLIKLGTGMLLDGNENKNIQLCCLRPQLFRFPRVLCSCQGSKPIPSLALWAFGQFPQNDAVRERFSDSGSASNHAPVIYLLFLLKHLPLNWHQTQICPQENFPGHSAYRYWLSLPQIDELRHLSNPLPTDALATTSQAQLSATASLPWMLPTSRLSSYLT